MFLKIIYNYLFEATAYRRLSIIYMYTACIKVVHYDSPLLMFWCRFIRGTCKGLDCPFSHKVSEDKMPVCSFFLKGICSRDSCPYRHVNVGRDAEPCLEFARGHCQLSEKVRYPNGHKTLNLCWSNVWPPPTMLGQHASPPMSDRLSMRLFCIFVLTHGGGGGFFSYYAHTYRTWCRCAFWGIWTLTFFLPYIFWPKYFDIWQTVPDR